MQDIVIVGVGGLGREIAEWIEDINDVRPTYRLLGFVDDDVTKHGSSRHDLPVLGGLDWLTERSRTVATAIGVGNPAPKRRVVERLKALGVSFPTIVHPHSVVGRYVVLGEGCVVCPGVVITTDVRVGSFVTFNFGLTVGHDATIEDYVTLAPGVNISGYVTIREGADLGANVATVPSVEIGAWSVVGAGAAVAKSLPANCTAVGVPARVIKTRAPGWHL
jgi:sugar O-acyltransferase (sialic acid O-acetyltransferase NeuD family)